MTNVKLISMSNISSFANSKGYSLVLSTWKDPSIEGDYIYVMVASNDDGTSPVTLSFPDGSATAPPEIVMAWKTPPVGPSVAAGLWRFPISPALTAQYLTVSCPVNRDLKTQIYHFRNSTKQADRVQVGPLFTDVPPTANVKVTAPGLQVVAPGGSSYGIGVMYCRLVQNNSVPSTFTYPDNVALVAGRTNGSTAVPANIMTGSYSALADGAQSHDITFTATTTAYAGGIPGSVLGFQFLVPSFDGDSRPTQAGFDNLISVDGWEATDGPVPAFDQFGNKWVVQDLQGWFGNLDVRSGDIDKPLADGVFGGPAPFAGRLVTVSGTLISPTRAALQTAFDRLASVLSGVQRFGELTVNEVVRQVVRTATVRLGGPVLINRTSATTAEFSLSLFAPDPSRYGADLNSIMWFPYKPSAGRTYDLVPPRVYGASGRSGVATVANNGNQPAWPIFKITASATNPAVRLGNGGPMLKVITKVVYPEVLTIDSIRRIVTVGDYSRRVQLSSDSEWFSLPPGASDLYFSTEVPTDSASCTVLWRDTYS